MRRLFNRLISRLHADRARLRRRRMGAAADRLDFVALDVRQPPRGVPSLPKGMTIRRVDDAELARDPLRYSFDRANVALALAEDQHCVVVESGDDVAAWVWVASDQTRVARMLGAQLAHLLPAVVTFDGYTHPAYRGHGLHRVLLASVADAARRDGRHHVVAWIAAWNSSARRNCDRLGFRAV